MIFGSSDFSTLDLDVFCQLKNNNINASNDEKHKVLIKHFAKSKNN